MMLRYSPPSPFARKVRVVAIEAGLGDQIELVMTNVPADAADLRPDNPLAKIPALIVDGVGSLFDSRVICEYLDSLHQGRKMFPAPGPARWTALRRQALADGILDAGVLIRYESLRPEGERSPDWVARQTTRVTAGLDALEREADGFAAEPSIGEITVGCCLGWLEFRKPTGEWRVEHPRLAAWYETFARRPSMVATPPDA